MKLLIALLVLALSAPTFAATTWSTDTSQDVSRVRVSKAVCTTGTESAPADGVGSPAVGVDLFGVKACTVRAEAAAAMTAGGILLAYALNPITNKWGRATGLDLTVSNVQYETFLGIPIVEDWSRIAFVPSGVGQAVTIYIECRRIW